MTVASNLIVFQGLFTEESEINLHVAVAANDCRRADYETRTAG
jgi:hypothetical protein